ncbi:hypothetical protein EKO29_08205 [Colwellia sp. Arc7-635]|uniref:hypothetical protein n=1 Tax=Colwellia sp. Arc7-635 TaxID=2497879 RepID=UPI000F853F1C|nr:hypothetical protein [Colwellia sp. Arc7-635]AZQ84000.1 hypothetical protein EKO29_08205 [Colwellia sp. Arc7-635]
MNKMTTDLNENKKEKQKVALIVGASGLIGQHLLMQLLASDSYSKVIALVRKPLTLEHSKLEQWQVDFTHLAEELKSCSSLTPNRQTTVASARDLNESNIQAHIHADTIPQNYTQNSTQNHTQNHIQSLDSRNARTQTGDRTLVSNSLASIDDIFFALGSTIKKAGSKAAFTEIDYHYPLIIAKHFSQQKTPVFAIVTAMAANESSAIFYNQTKGKVESSLRNIGFKHLGIFRPSMLTGQRSEYRLGEQLGAIVMSAFAFLIPKKYQIIEAKKVASAMLTYAENPPKGVTIIQSDQLQNY